MAGPKYTSGVYEPAPRIWHPPRPARPAPAANTVFEAFMATSAAAPDHAFLCATPTPGRAYHPDGVELTYAQVREPVLRLRDQYAAAGYGHGHRIALLFENRPEFFFH